MSRYLLLAFFGALTVEATTHVNLSDSISGDSSGGCSSPYTMVAGRCLYINFATSGTWDRFHSMYCKDTGGNDLVTVDDANFLADLVQYITSIGWQDGLFWIGASDKSHEGHWIWPNGSPVKMGTPFWGTYGCYNQQYPDGGTNENCAILDGNANLYFNDFKCDTALAVFGICEKNI
uniref:C-type lectin 1 n=1 Tax=Portunus trituberculatus TaxID=210409 RepID=A0A6G6CT87_PORTR|nr:C-type lectin 1 [Portunus trituberculatus]